MSISAAVNNFDLSAGTGNKTSASLGFAPQAVLAFFNNLVATGSGADAHIGVGMSGSNANELVHYFNSLDAAASSDVVRSNLNDTFIKTTVGGATTARVTATMSSLNADDFTINTTANVTSAKLPFVAWGGLDGATAGEVNMPNSTSDFSVTGLAFQPDIVFLSVVLLAATGTANNNNSFSFGVAKSSSEMWCAAVKSQNAQATMNTSRAFYDNRCAVVLQSTGDTAVDEIGFSAFTSDGFTLTHPVNSGGGYTIHYLAMKGGQWAVGTLNQPGSTGNQSVTGLSFTPVGTLFGSAGYETANAVTPTARIMIGAATSSSARRCIWMGDEDNAANAKADQRYVTDKCIELYDEAGAGAPTILSAADYVSNNSDGFTINWTTADATARKVGYVTFGNVVANPPVPRRDVTVNQAIKRAAYY